MTKLIGAGLVLLGLAGMAPTAALAGTPSCPAGRVCVWHDDSFNSQRYVYGDRDSTYTNDHFANGWRVNDAVSSVCNTTNECIRFYWDSNYKGPNFGLAPGRCYSNIKNMYSWDVDWNFNDQLSAHQPVNPWVWTGKQWLNTCEWVYDY